MDDRGQVLGISEQAVWRNHVLVIISNRFGLNCIGPEYYKVIKKYMKLPSFTGLVGGKPRFAYYFVGHLEKPAGQHIDQSVDNSDELDFDTYDETDRLVFLDPHYVNSQVDFGKELTSQSGLYHC